MRVTRLNRSVLVLLPAGLLVVVAVVWLKSGGVPPGQTANPASTASPVSANHQATLSNSATAPSPAPEGMVWIPGGEFSMGTDDPTEMVCGGRDRMQDARPIHRVHVDGFWMDRTEVTNDQFARFIAATGYLTVAERVPSAADFPTVPKEDLVPGSLVFTPTPEPVPLDNFLAWWRYQPEANWRHPEGPGTTIEGRGGYPVVQVAYEDALAYAKWAGNRLPTEAEWEFAARGGASGQPYTWGSILQPNGRWMANIYQGQFPNQDSGGDGFVGLAPVAQFPPNPYGLHDLAGNVWEWCSDWYRPDYYAELARGGGVARNPTGPAESLDPGEPGVPKRVHRGGSFLCTDQYCTRYLVGARDKGELSTASNHLGFRCVRSSGKTN